jgi:hypothetical protein
MATQENNVVMRNASGMFGGQVVFRQRAGKTVLAAPPTIDPNRVVTATEEAFRARFKQATRFASGAMSDPLLKETYAAIAKPGQSAFNVAFTDVYYAPEILGILTQNYSGGIGSLIAVQAIDNVRVKTVRVRITTAADVLIEEGNAVVDFDGTTFNYTATVLNASVDGSKIIATAIDLAGNETVLEAIL